jgi:hypothetical protein
MSQVQTQTQEQKPQIPIPENQYIDVNYDYSLTAIDYYKLEEDVKEALNEAEKVIRRGWSSKNEAKRIVEEKVRQMLGDVASIVKYSFDESIDWDVIDINDIEVERAYDAIDTLEICFRNGVTIEFGVRADYAIVLADKEYIVYFKINEIKLSRLWWYH